MLPDKGAISFDSFGGRVASFLVPDRNGQLGDVVLGPLNPGDSRLDRTFMGAVVGRFAGRIAGASFAIDGTRYQLAPNSGPNLLHGGADSFSHRDWNIVQAGAGNDRSLRFALISADGDQGFPGAVSVRASYRWDEGKSLQLDIEADSTRPTPFNMTQHIYWNLGGPGAADVCDRLLQIKASHYLPIRADSVPTGEIRAVDGTAFDFCAPRSIGQCLSNRDEQIQLAQGIDHCWVLEGEGFREVAALFHPPSGRKLTVLTDQGGLQVYTANHFGDGPAGKGGAPYGRHAGIALETQAFPNAPNQPDWPDTILRPGMTYRSRTLFAFS